MAEIQDPLLRRLNHDIRDHHMTSAAMDAAAVIRRDTDLSNPLNTKLRLERDAAILVGSGISSAMLVHFGILPHAQIHHHMPGALRGIVRNF
jgi:hypothetical protein